MLPCRLGRLQGQNDGLFNSRVYWGGPTEDGALLLLHGDPGARLHPRCSLELAPGLYLELSRLAVARAACGDLSRVRRAARPPAGSPAPRCSPACRLAWLAGQPACWRRSCSTRLLPPHGGVATPLPSRLPSTHACCCRCSACPDPQGTLRFFSGCCTWGPGELEQQLAAGAWQPAAASRALVLKHAAQLPQGLWHELACMAGMQAGAACQV